MVTPEETITPIRSSELEDEAAATPVHSLAGARDAAADATVGPNENAVDPKDIEWFTEEWMNRGAWNVLDPWGLFSRRIPEGISAATNLEPQS
jgi:hypothetical protein